MLVQPPTKASCGCEQPTQAEEQTLAKSTLHYLSHVRFDIKKSANSEFVYSFVDVPAISVAFHL